MGNLKKDSALVCFQTFNEVRWADIAKRLKHILIVKTLWLNGYYVA